MESAVFGTVIDPQAANASPEALVATFEALRTEADFPGFLKILGIGRFSFSGKRRMEPVFTALCTELWRLALQSAVPDRSHEAYTRFQNSLWSKLRDADTFMVLLRDIAQYLPEQGNADFTPAARELFARAGRIPDQSEAVRMALFLRRLYDYFFNHLM